MKNTTERTIEVLSFVVRVLESAAAGLREDRDHDHAEVLEVFAEEIAAYAIPVSEDFFGEGDNLEDEGGDLDLYGADRYPLIEEVLRGYQRDLEEYRATGWSHLHRFHEDGDFVNLVRKELEHYSDQNDLGFLPGTTDEQILEAMSASKPRFHPPLTITDPKPSSSHEDTSQFKKPGKVVQSSF